MKSTLAMPLLMNDVVVDDCAGVLLFLEFEDPRQNLLTAPSSVEIGFTHRLAHVAVRICCRC